MALRVMELTGSDGSNLGISQEESACEVTYQLESTVEGEAPTVNEVSEWIDSTLGGVENLEPRVVDVGTEGAGKIVRRLPKVHPWRPEMTAAGLVSLSAVTERHDAENASAVPGLTPITNQWPNAHAYRARIKFIKRPYFLLPNEKLSFRRTSYYDPTGTELDVYVVDELRRFTVITREPLSDTVSATFGNMKIRTASEVAPPHNDTYSGSQSMYLQNQNIIVDWFNVPYRYFDNFGDRKSYLTRFVGTINQSEFLGFPPGSLLYLGATPTSVYIPVTPKRQKILRALTIGLSQGLLCNVRMKFLYTARQGTDVPTFATNPALLGNRNRVAAGHNLLPSFATRTFRYVASQPESNLDADREPSFQSFEFNLFGTDPLLSQPAGPI